ncbi:hypothetical protein [Vibrio parahaemolyticus]|uniref:hypothetical protein n=1 Tax=Vibrio parahaemolyticus TaxID=670 RepID=UPI001120FB00|nr:hypothetical protein [Vibrio parahaemolyticus]EHR0803251.1 hypothetical protein [Vibrio parahaemolyticus]ELA7626253.1 hypothetical protein [Vibrio parahaemolyticus]ELE6572972.1 hypothetical protein [Vibrio parahaemolyticus]MBD6964860.1 hypothetical protein [Vibrio parahaemolyticus]TOI05204.1 hypothetical protein CGI68_23735 [Vibrio parahaemolyticus]
MPKANTSNKSKLNNQLQSINNNLTLIANNLNSEEEDKYKVCCEMFTKTFEHEKQKAVKIEDKANKILAFLLAISSVYLALIIWFIKEGHEKSSPILINSSSTNISMLLLIIGAAMLLTSISKSTSVMWAKLEYNPVASFKHFHHFDKPDKKAIDVYKYYAEFYSDICDKRRDNNLERGDLLGKAFSFTKSTVIYCLISSLYILLTTSTFLSG